MPIKMFIKYFIKKNVLILRNWWKIYKNTKINKITSYNSSTSSSFTYLNWVIFRW